MTTCYFCRNEIDEQEIVFVVTKHGRIHPMHKRCRELAEPEIHDTRGDETEIILKTASLWINGGGDSDGFLHLIGDIYDAIRDLEYKIECMKKNDSITDS